MIKFELSGVPPSTNKAYFNLPRGGRSLSATGKKYKAETTSQLVRHYPNDLRMFSANTAYGILIVVSMQILNAGWPQTAKTRYKKLDATNRVKLLEDALMDACGIDDSQFLFSAVIKQQAHADERENTTVWCWNLETEEVIPAYVREYLRTLRTA